SDLRARDLDLRAAQQPLPRPRNAAAHGAVGAAVRRRHSRRGRRREVQVRRAARAAEGHAGGRAQGRLEPATRAPYGLHSQQFGLNEIRGDAMPEGDARETSGDGGVATARETLSVTDNRTGKTYELENVKKFVEGFRHDAHPMGMLVGSVGALSTFYPDAKHIDDEEERHMAAVRLIAKMPTLAAFAYRHQLGLPYVYPDNDLSYPGNFLSMMYKMTEVRYEPDPRLERALDVLWILHADHEQNCSTNAVRGVGSSQVDTYSACAAGIGTHYGQLHGGANEAVLR